MTLPRDRRLPTARALSSLVLAGSLALTSACGGEEPEAKSSTTTSPTATPSAGQLTEAGASLDFGEAATVSYVPNQKRSSFLKVSVNKVQQGRLKDLAAFELDDRARSSAIYYASVEVTNVEGDDVGGTGVPLWATGAGKLVQASGFTTRFRRCPSKPLPRPFGPDDTYSGCLVFLIPDKGTLSGIAFRGADADEPVTWSGEITPAEKSATKKKKKKKKARN